MSLIPSNPKYHLNPSVGLMRAIILLAAAFALTFAAFPAQGIPEPNVSPNGAGGSESPCYSTFTSSRRISEPLTWIKLDASDKAVSTFVPTQQEDAEWWTGTEVLVGDICSLVQKIIECLLQGFSHSECGMTPVA